MTSSRTDDGLIADTWPKALKANYEKYGAARTALRYKRYGIWTPYKWKDYYLDVKHFSLGLIALGFEQGDKLLILGDNAPQWYVAEIAAHAAHGISLGVDPDATPSELDFIARAGQVRFAVVQDQEQVDKLFEARGNLPFLEKVIYWRPKGLAHYRDEMLIGFDDLLEQGKRLDAKQPGIFEKNVEAGSADDVCALVCTSGTTGQPRLAMHTARTLKAGAEQLLRLHPWREEDDLVPLFAARMDFRTVARRRLPFAFGMHPQLSRRAGDGATGRRRNRTNHRMARRSLLGRASSRVAGADRPG